MQKPLSKKAGKANAKALAANRHGKIVKTKKGRMDKTQTTEVARVRSEKEMSAGINAKNELEMARRAVVNGGALSVVKPPDGTVAAAKGPKPKKRKPSSVVAKKDDDDGDDMDD